MFYTEWNVADKTMKLRLTTMGAMQLEDKLGRNPAEIFLALSDGQLPKIKDVVFILHQALQPFNSGYSVEKTANLLDAYFEEGHSIYDLITNEIMQTFKNAGLLGQDVDEEEASEEDPN